MSAGSTIREIRTRKGLTVSQLANMAKVGSSQLVNWENDKVSISAKNLEKVLNAMGWTLVARKIKK